MNLWNTNAEDSYGQPRIAIRIGSHCRRTYLGLEGLDTVRDLKVAFEDRTGLEPRYQRFMFAGIELKDDRRLSDYNIGPDSEI